MVIIMLSFLSIFLGRSHFPDLTFIEAHPPPPPHRGDRQLFTSSLLGLSNTEEWAGRKIGAEGVKIEGGRTTGRKGECGEKR